MRKLFFVALLALALPATAAWPDQFSIYGIGAKSAPNKHGQWSFQSLNFEATGRAKWPFDWGLVFAPTHMTQPVDFFDTPHATESVNAASLSLLARKTFSQRGSVKPYIEISSGPIYASKRVPEMTSHFNFVSQAGVGIITTGRTPLMAGIRVFHISNAGYADRNPGINFTSILLGLRFH